MIRLLLHPPLDNLSCSLNILVLASVRDAARGVLPCFYRLHVCLQRTAVFVLRMRVLPLSRARMVFVCALYWRRINRVRIKWDRQDGLDGQAA